VINVDNKVNSNFVTMNFTTYGSKAGQVYEGIFQINGQISFGGNWTVTET
jgi:hypothetical protein